LSKIEGSEFDIQEASEDLDLCDTLKNGKMYIQGSNNKWEPFFFALTTDKLIYTEIDEEKETDNDCTFPMLGDAHRRSVRELINHTNVITVLLHYVSITIVHFSFNFKPTDLY